MTNRFWWPRVFGCEHATELRMLTSPEQAVVMHRDFAGRSLDAVLVAPLTTTLRDIPTAVRLGPADGLDRECMAALDSLTLLRKDRFVRAVARLSSERMAQLCAALATATACDVAIARHRFGPSVDPPSS